MTGNPIRLVYMDGGLGNQVFQYVFARYIEEFSGQPCTIDDTSFFREVVANPETNDLKDPQYRFPDSDYQLDKVFNIQARLLSKQHSEDEWQHIVERYRSGTSYAQQLLEKDINLFVIAETTPPPFGGNLVFVPLYQFTPTIFQTQGNVYYHGYWICKKWFQAIRKTMLKELVFPPITDSANLGYLAEIQNSNSVGVHVRRYVDASKPASLPCAYYVEGVKWMQERVADPTYFIFSNDIDWCQRHVKELGFAEVKNRVVFVTGNMPPGERCFGRANYIDMQLMCMCKHLVIANSSFSFLASLLSSSCRSIYFPNWLPYNEI